MENGDFEIAEKRCKIPYKSCRLWRVLGLFSENAMQKYAKSITVIDWSEVGGGTPSSERRIFSSCAGA